MVPWIQVCAILVCSALLVAGQQEHVLYDSEVEAEAEARALDHHSGGGGGGGGGGGHGHGKATSYQLSNNWAYHPVKVYVKHGHGGKHHDDA